MIWETVDVKAPKLGILGICVEQEGQGIEKRLYDEECRRNIYSASKSFTALAVGIAMREGLLSLDEKLVDAFCEDLPAHPDENLRAATVRDLLTMCLGQKEAMLMGAQRPLYTEDDWVKLCLSVPLVHKPGTVFCYNNAGPYLAGVLVQRRAGCDLVHYLEPRLFAPMGIRYPTWEHDPMGYTFGAGGLFLTLDELHRLGKLCLQDGAWQGKQLVPAAWIQACTQKQVDNGQEGYGYLFWRGMHESYRADGKYGQRSVVFPDKRAVITMVAECRDIAGMDRLLMEDLYPQLA